VNFSSRNHSRTSSCLLFASCQPFKNQLSGKEISGQIPLKAGIAELRGDVFSPIFSSKMPFLVARGQGRGLKAGSAGGEDPMKDRLSSAKKGGKGLAICAYKGRFRPYR
jgi:hypothetical protein